jgi:hypothetical protein
MMAWGVRMPFCSPASHRLPPLYSFLCHLRLRSPHLRPSKPKPEYLNPAVPVRTVADHPFRLHDWNLRFYASSTMHQPSSQGAEERLRLAVSEAVAAAPIGVWDEAGGGNGGWWEAFRNEHLRMLSFGDHETFDHPVACENAVFFVVLWFFSSYISDDDFLVAVYTLQSDRCHHQPTPPLARMQASWSCPPPLKATQSQPLQKCSTMGHPLCSNKGSWSRGF